VVPAIAVTCAYPTAILIYELRSVLRILVTVRTYLEIRFAITALVEHVRHILGLSPSAEVRWLAAGGIITLVQDDVC
jgi:hypothetical protein